MSFVRRWVRFAVHVLTAYLKLHFPRLLAAGALASVQYVNYRVALKLRAIQTALLCA